MKKQVDLHKINNIICFCFIFIFYFLGNNKATYVETYEMQSRKIEN